MAASPRVLSSAQTFTTKLILPIVWIGLFGIGAVFVVMGDVRSASHGGPPLIAKWLIPIIWVAVSAFIIKVCGTLKRVAMDDEYLYVSDYLNEIRVPLNAIESVTQNLWINIRPITIRFRTMTDFGQSITFMPKVQFLAWSTYPVVDELRRAAGIAVKDSGGGAWTRRWR